MNKILLRRRAFRFLAKFGDNMKAKFNNICSKTGSYSVPLELFQKRTPRKNRVLISWEAVIENRISLAQLNSFEGGVAVEFKNNDFFNPKNHSNPLFIELSQRLGSNENVASIISIRSEAGSSSSALQREAFNKLTSGTKLFYKGSKIVLTQRNYADYAILNETMLIMQLNKILEEKVREMKLGADSFSSPLKEVSRTSLKLIPVKSLLCLIPLYNNH